MTTTTPSEPPGPTHEQLAEERRARRAAERRVRALEESTSYRLGHALVLLVAHPLRFVRRALLGLFRLVNSRLDHETRRRILGWGEDHVPAPVMRRLRALNTASKPARRTPATRRPSTTRDAPPELPVLSDDLPVDGYLLLGVPDDRLGALVRDIRTLAHVRGDHVPLVITDSRAFGVLRAEHVAFEYVPDATAWQAGGTTVPWEDFVRDRIDHLRACHSLRSLVAVLPSEAATRAITRL